MTSLEKAVDPEPPSTTVPADQPDVDAVERVMAASHVASAAHVAVIGHHTLPYVLALMRRGCACVRSLRPDAPAPDREPADLTWIVDFRDDHELDDALRAARGRAGSRGRVVLEGGACRWRRTLATMAIAPCGPASTSSPSITRQAVSFWRRPHGWQWRLR